MNIRRTIAALAIPLVTFLSSGVASAQVFPGGVFDDNDAAIVTGPRGNSALVTEGNNLGYGYGRGYGLGYGGYGAAYSAVGVSGYGLGWPAARLDAAVDGCLDGDNFWGPNRFGGVFGGSCGGFDSSVNTQNSGIINSGIIH